MANMGNAGARVAWPALQRVWTSIGSTFKPQAERLADLAAQTAPQWGKAFAKPAETGVLGNLFNNATWFIRKPVEKLTRVAGRGMDAWAQAYAHNPALTGTLTVGGLAAGTYIGANASHERREAEARQMEYQMAMQQVAAAQSPYMNSVTPAESALLDARMREGSNGGSLGEKVLSDRAAASVPSTNV
jgi:hypothetical protein